MPQSACSPGNVLGWCLKVTQSCCRIWTVAQPRCLFWVTWFNCASWEKCRKGSVPQKERWIHSTVTVLSLLMITAVINCRDNNLFFPPLTLHCCSAKFAASREVSFCTKFGKQYRDAHVLAKMKFCTIVTRRPRCTGKVGKQLETALSFASAAPGLRWEAAATKKTSFRCRAQGRQRLVHEERKEARGFEGRSKRKLWLLEWESLLAVAVSCPFGTAHCKGLTPPPVSTKCGA